MAIDAEPRLYGVPAELVDSTYLPLVREAFPSTLAKSIESGKLYLDHPRGVSVAQIEVKMAYSTSLEHIAYLTRQIPDSVDPRLPFTFKYATLDSGSHSKIETFTYFRAEPYDNFDPTNRAQFARFLKQTGRIHDELTPVNQTEPDDEPFVPNNKQRFLRLLVQSGRLEL